MSLLEAFVWGLAGGIGAEVSVLFAHRHRAPGDIPYYLKGWFYYVAALLMILFGGIVALAHASTPGITLNAILAIQIGASAPLIFRKLSETIAESPEPPDPAKID